MTTASDSRPPAFHVMAKPRGAICNLGCEYCYYLPKKALYPGGTFRMSNQVLKSYVRQYIAAQQVPQVHFAWQGGEPTLMGLDFFRRVVGYQKEAARPGMRIENAIQTNGTLLNDDWCRFFAENHFLVGISLDGPREMHDVYRKDKGNRGTFDRVIHGIRLLKDYQVDFNILTCVSAANAEKPLEVYHFLRDEVGAEFIQFIPIVEWERPTDPQKERKLSERSVNGEQYGYFLNSIFDDWLAHDLSKIFVQIFDTSFGHWIGAPGGLCVFQETCGLALVTEHNGDVYSCDHFVEPDCYLGNMLKTPLAEMVGSEKQRQFGLAKRNSLPQYCRSCSFLFACNGGCPKDRTDITPDGEPGLNHLCSGFKTFFAHVDSPFRIMANLIRQHRPMTDVMKILENSN
ncbi:MAG TPA: anaerobic sulfatase maturase [Flexilinea sp.]|nr:anaerobic sulfatase maturase [Flexilinea sp.]HPR69871.1 anaerobic sulfatase maturase [Flexilinea sp.]